MILVFMLKITYIFSHPANNSKCKHGVMMMLHCRTKIMEWSQTKATISKICKWQPCKISFFFPFIQGKRNMHHTIHTFAFHTHMRMLLVPKCAFWMEKIINRNNNKNKYLKISVIHAMDVICRKSPRILFFKQPYSTFLMCFIAPLEWRIHFNVLTWHTWLQCFVRKMNLFAI